MSDATLDLSNLGLEFEIIAHALQAGGLPEGLKPEHFAGKKPRWIAKQLDKSGTSCSIAMLISELVREGREVESEEYEALLTRLSEQNVNADQIPDSVERIKSLSTGRKLAEILTRSNGVAELLKKQKIEDAVSVLEDFLFAEHSMEGVLSEGSFIDSAESILADIDKLRLQEEFQGCPTYIKPIDEAIHGLLGGEFGLIVGGTGEGKSIAMLDIGMRNWDWGGKDVLGISIEMKQRQQEFRQIAWACGIEINRFRTGDITNEERQRIANYFEIQRERENIFYWVDIPENVNAAQIQRKIIQAERKTGREFDMILIDYIGLMSPIGRHGGRIDWDSQAEVAWNVHNLARKTGKVVWSAAQRKENISESQRLSGGLKNIGLSYMISQPTDIVLVFVEKALEGFMEINIAKGRDVGKDRVKLKPDMRHARIHRFDEDADSTES